MIEIVYRPIVGGAKGAPLYKLASQNGCNKLIKIRFLGEKNKFLGYAGGFKQPILTYQASVECRSDPVSLSHQIGDLESLLGIESSNAITTSPQFVIHRLAEWTTALLEKNNHPVCQPAQIKPTQNSANEFVVIQPCLNPDVTSWLVDNLAMLLEKISGDIDGEIAEISRRLQETKLRGFNQYHFIKSAGKKNIPWQILPGGVAILGWGKNSRWLESSITDKTPTISTKIARNKLRTAEYLHNAGLPVPHHLIVRNENDLSEGVRRLGFPLVVKPVGKDGGVGVKANLFTFEEVLKAFHHVQEISKEVLLEKHVPGKDYRIQIVNDEVQGVLERSAGGVYGNGFDTVKKLVVRQNEERKTAEDDRKYLHQISLDEEAVDQLKSQNLTWESVPEAAVFVRLRGACNVASGGVPTEIPLDEIHHDNICLSVNAARALRLDVAGIDLLIPDISQSWLETGANICEVNAQPQMFTSMHGPMLEKIFQGGKGRIPVVAILSSDKEKVRNFLEKISANMLRKGQTIGTAIGGEVNVAADCITPSAMDCYMAVRMLCGNVRVDQIFFNISGFEDTKNGWAVDECDTLVIDTNLPGEEGAQSANFEKMIQALRTLNPSKVIVNKAAHVPEKFLSKQFKKAQFGAYDDIMDAKVEMFIVRHDSRLNQR